MITKFRRIRHSLALALFFTIIMAGVASATYYDYGDLPSSFSSADKNAYHRYVSTSPSLKTGVRLGAGWDGELGNSTSSDATGDDTNSGMYGGPDDEDGVVMTPGWVWTAGGQGKVNLTITTDSSENGCLAGWADWNNNSSFADSGENIIPKTAVTPGTATYAFSIPANWSGWAIFRFRVYRQSGGSCSSVTVSTSNQVTGGEVEDYKFSVPLLTATTTRSGNLNNNNITPGTKISDTVYLTATNSSTPIAGAVQFYYCQGTIVTLPNCSTDPLTAIGSPVSVTAGTNGGKQVATASSANVSFGSGSYCFKAVFTPAGGSPYPSASETNQLDTGGRAECIRVSGATAVTVSSFEASSTLALATDGTLAGLGLAGVLALGGVALLVWRKR
ncbi:MAG: hypothetical protein HZB53_00970 [Chloroflexi bacterium]|nr:hypothetical protein [Chloroflexota bacterium]